MSYMAKTQRLILLLDLDGKPSMDVQTSTRYLKKLQTNMPSMYTLGDCHTISIKFPEDQSKAY